MDDLLGILTKDRNLTRNAWVNNWLDCSLSTEQFLKTSGVDGGSPTSVMKEVQAIEEAIEQEKMV